MSSLRVHFITHHDGALTARLIPAWRHFFEGPPPTAYGRTEPEVLQQLQHALEDRLAQRKDTLERYTWDETFDARRILIHIHPQTTIDKRPVIAKQEVPILLTYICSQLPGGGARILLPRFDWSLIVEDLSIADSTLRQAVSSALLGEDARWLFDFRHEGPEYVKEWSPSLAPPPAPSQGDGHADASRAPTLFAVADEWVWRASHRKLPHAVGAAPDSLTHAKQWLRTSSPPPSLLIVGPHGVGKTTWVRRLAQHLVQWRRDEPHAAWPKLWATSADRLIAGQIYLGMWQQRCHQLLQELQHQGDYLYVDHALPLLREQPGGGAVADILVPALLSGHISLIAECTPSDLILLQRSHPDLVQACKLIRLQPPSVLDMPALLSAYQAKLPGAPTLPPSALQRLSRHLDHFQRHLSFPGKGFIFLDWLHKTSAADASVSLPDPASAPARAVSPPTTPNGISEAFSRFSGLPVELISDAHIADAPHIAAALRARVIGQDAATLAVAEVIARFKAGLHDPARPCGSLLFVGPTGVGKTELAKQTAAYMFGSPERLIRLDMSEYMMPGSAQRLLAPAQGRSLPERLRQQPLSLILLDEVEKAHPDVFDLLLSVLGEGRLTDTSGHLVDLRMAVIILTSNLGVQEAAPPAFSAPPASTSSHAEDRFTRAVRQHFRPELFNRLDRVISFRHLAPPDITQIVALELASLPARAGLSRRHLRLRVCPTLTAWLADHGYHPTRGARPLKRLIEEYLVSPLSVFLSERPSLSRATIHLLTAASPPSPPDALSLTLPTPSIRAS